MADKEFYRVADVLKMLQISRSSLHRYISIGDFPQPMRKIGRLPIWGREQIEEWKQNRYY